LTNFEINLLVHLALNGPREADSWRPVTDRPAEIGAQLRARNVAAAGDPEDKPRAYEYEPLSLELSAVEGLKQVSHYLYQTADDEGAWRRGTVGRFIDSLQSSLVSALPGWAEAPWSWSVRDVLDHEPKPLSETEPVVDPRVKALLDRFEQLGVTLVPSPEGSPVVGVADARSILGVWHYPEKYSGFPPFHVSLLSHEAIAAHHYLRLRSDADRIHPDVHVGLFRFEAAVVRIEWHAWVVLPDGPREEELWALVDGLGDPDERWTSLEPPLFTGAGEVLARRVRTTPTHPHQVRMVVAHDHRTLGRLSPMILDESVRADVESVDLRSQIVLLVNGVAEPGELLQLTMREFVSIGTYDPAHPSFKIELVLEEAVAGVGSILVIDRPPHVPEVAEVRWPSLPSMGLSVDEPPEPEG
jgi:hypothetical protein